MVKIRIIRDIRRQWNEKNLPHNLNKVISSEFPADYLVQYTSDEGRSSNSRNVVMRTNVKTVIRMQLV